MQGGSSAKEREAAYQHVRGWTTHVDLFTKDYIFVPINEGLHRSLAVVCRPGLWAQQQHAALPSQQPAAAEEEDSDSEEDESDGDGVSILGQRLLDKEGRGGRRSYDWAPSKRGERAAAAAARRRCDVTAVCGPVALRRLLLCSRPGRGRARLAVRA
mmetsp:Transcript_37519/g.118064  ORF Transcript_37519/g.118064 Transcript_37519/m.118064 type:complete len:157 (-) Transcript_37519:893-1363(-)